MKARATTSVVLALAVAFGTAGCGFVAPQATTKHYDASDGVSGNLGQIDIRNALIVTDGTSKVGNLVVTLVNTGSKSHRVAISAGDQRTPASSVTVEPGEVKNVGATPGKASASNVFLLNFTALPGSLSPVYFQYGDETGVQLAAPVLDGGLSEYKDLVPPAILPAS